MGVAAFELQGDEWGAQVKIHHDKDRRSGFSNAAHRTFAQLLWGFLSVVEPILLGGRNGNALFEASGEIV